MIFRIRFSGGNVNGSLDALHKQDQPPVTRIAAGRVTRGEVFQEPAVPFALFGAKHQDGRVGWLRFRQQVAQAPGED